MSADESVVVVVVVVVVEVVVEAVVEDDNDDDDDDETATAGNGEFRAETIADLPPFGPLTYIHKKYA